MSEPMTDGDLADIERGAMFAGPGYDDAIEAIETLVAEVRRLRTVGQGMVAESSWDELADAMTEVEADNARLRDGYADLVDAARDVCTPVQPSAAKARLRACLARIDELEKGGA